MKDAPYLHREKTRHGKEVLYFRKGKGRRIRISGDMAPEEFAAMYESLIADPPQGRPVHRLLARKIRAALWRDREKNRQSDIDMSWFKARMAEQGYRCALTGLPFQWDMNTDDRLSPLFPSLDRIDNSRGYTKDNVRVVATAINLMRMDWGAKTFDRIVGAYVERNCPAPRPGAGDSSLTPIEMFEKIRKSSKVGDPGSCARQPIIQSDTSPNLRIASD